MINAHREVDWVLWDAVLACLRRVFTRLLGETEKSNGSQFRESDQTRQLRNTKNLAADKVR